MKNSNCKTVLFVDDDVCFTDLIEEELKSAGFNVLTARTLSEAKGIINSNHFDAAVLDVCLDVGNFDDIDPEDIHNAAEGKRSGLVLAKWIKEDYPDTFFIAYSNVTSEEVLFWFRKYGGGFLSKIGYKPYEVVKRICKATGVKPHGVPKCFIVHGHDKTMKFELKNFLQNILRFPEPIILHEQPNLGRTIIEKFEDESEDTALVFVLLTPDDKEGNPNDTNDEKRRARQNVILEMGYFLAKFGRKSGRVILLHKGEIELPSDIAGLVYIDISNGIEAAGQKIRNELKEFLP